MEPDRATIRQFHAMARAYGIDAPFCCIENDFTLGSPAEHQAMLRRSLRAMADAARCGAIACEPEDRDCKLSLLRGRIEYCHLKDWLPHGAGWPGRSPAAAASSLRWMT